MELTRVTSSIRSFRDLIAWQKSMTLCKSVYEVTKCLPDSERYGLIAQLRRAAVSVPSNIAEGYTRRRKQDYLRFLDMARGSLAEISTQLTLAVDLQFVTSNETQSCTALVDESNRILFALAKSVEETCD